jgi:hypothetical protein
MAWRQWESGEGSAVGTLAVCLGQRRGPELADRLAHSRVGAGVNERTLIECHFPYATAAIRPDLALETLEQLVGGVLRGEFGGLVLECELELVGLDGRLLGEGRTGDESGGEGSEWTWLLLCRPFRTDP